MTCQAAHGNAHGNEVCASGAQAACQRSHLFCQPPTRNMRDSAFCSMPAYAAPCVHAHASKRARQQTALKRASPIFFFGSCSCVYLPGLALSFPWRVCASAACCCTCWLRGSCLLALSCDAALPSFSEHCCRCGPCMLALVLL